MKTSHIIAIILIAIATAIVITTFDDASAYLSFNEAKELAIAGEDKDVHIVGELKKDNSGNILGMSYDPMVDPNYFSFLLVDENGVEEEVIFFNPKPADLEKSEKVVIIGSFKKGKFIAKDILLKCPSKYVEDEINENS